MTAPNEYIIGQVVVLEDVITDPATLLLTNDSSEAVTVYAPDGTTTLPLVTHVSLGTYTAQVTPNQSGWWEYVFMSTGLGAGAGKGSFYVSPVP